MRRLSSGTKYVGRRRARAGWRADRRGVINVGMRAVLIFDCVEVEFHYARGKIKPGCGGLAARRAEKEGREERVGSIKTRKSRGHSRMMTS